MTKRIFRSILLATITVLLISLMVVTGVLYSLFDDMALSQLHDELNLAARGVEMWGEEYLAGLSSENLRITWVAEDGAVLYDTQVDADGMDNHAEREEITEAFATGYGESMRYSMTLTESMFYSARRLSDGTVLRAAMEFDSVLALILDMLLPVIVMFILTVFLSAILARRMARSIVSPLNELDLDNPAENDAYEELSPILGKINRQHRQIDDQMAQLKQQTDEFEQIISSMNEGLVLLDEKGFVISMNPAARKLFGADDGKVSMDFLALDRSPEMSRAVERAFAGEHGGFRAAKNGGEWQFDISRIESEGRTLGAVILAFDVTQQALAEQTRREFSANVSHELKTPLQSIIGSAELLENGLVKPEDTQRFVGHIKTEAARLVTLINDIIRISQLDEQSETPSESVDLREVAQEAVEALSASAAKRNVTLDLDAEPCTVSGVRRYLYEIIYNLCDNAIRYNREGGRVDISVKNGQGSTIITVADTGIGIPPEHHSRIFERFYRVDKSHSKETGGTGLGLSIVKHAVAYHGGRLELDSTPGKGTTITVTF